MAIVKHATALRMDSYIPEKTFNKIVARAKAEGYSISGLVKRVMTEYIEEPIDKESAKRRIEEKKERKRQRQKKTK